MIRSRSRFQVPNLTLPVLVVVVLDREKNKNKDEDTGLWMFISIYHQVHRGKMGLALGLLWFVHLSSLQIPPFNVLLI